MRIIFALPLLTLGACNVDNDSENDTVTFEYNQERIEDAASDTVNAAGDAASAIGNVTKSAGDAIENEVGDIDVDVTRNKSGNSN